jgi:hypothetical protein
MRTRQSAIANDLCRLRVLIAKTRDAAAGDDSRIPLAVE